MLEPQEIGFTHPIKGPETIAIAIKDAKEIIERVAKENNFDLSKCEWDVTWPPMSSDFLECLQVVFFKDGWSLCDYVLFTVEEFWVITEKIAINAIKELNEKCSNLKKKRSLTD